MSSDMDLDPQLKDFLQKADLLNSIEDDSHLSLEQMRQGFDNPYKYERRQYCMHAKCSTDLFATISSTKLSVCIGQPDVCKLRRVVHTSLC